MSTLLTVKEAAQMLRLSEHTVRRYIYWDKTIPTVVIKLPGAKRGRVFIEKSFVQSVLNREF